MDRPRSTCNRNWKRNDYAQMKGSLHHFWHYIEEFENLRHNIETGKENIMIVLGCMDLDLALREEQPTPLSENSSTEDKLFGAMSEVEIAKKFPEEIEQRFVKNEKAETSNLLANLISMKYKGEGNVREYIMHMSNISSKLKALNLDLSEDLLVHLVLISLSAQYSKFKVSCNTQKDNWTLSELISHCVQEEDRIKRERAESAHLATVTT
ncbi:uncharacterized protein LOC120002594 [Tripterygium wilfordii]|uniref:uncharacterized protein LOC120002594 n=1 Tax=Tripterygium wilfordii TaxID=458696 RepID=UPI0018F837B1|nr:uncharacterized protein LOC120002594 [Tripterygium wilfordii]